MKDENNNCVQINQIAIKKKNAKFNFGIKIMSFHSFNEC